MAKKGVAQTTIMEVAKKSQTSHPLVTYHFPNINQLYLGVINDILEEMRLATVKVIEQDYATAQELLTNYVEVLFHWGEKNRDKIQLWVYFYYLATVDQEFAVFNDQVRKVGRERIESILLKGIAYGEFPKTPRPKMKDLTISIQGLITGNIIMAVSETNLSLKEAARVTSETAAAMVLFSK